MVNTPVRPTTVVPFNPEIPPSRNADHPSGSMLTSRFAAAYTHRNTRSPVSRLTATRNASDWRNGGVQRARGGADVGAAAWSCVR